MSEGDTRLKGTRIFALKMAALDRYQFKFKFLIRENAPWRHSMNYEA